MFRPLVLIALASFVGIGSPAVSADMPNVHVKQITILSLSFVGRTPNDSTPAYLSAEIVIGTEDGVCGGAYRYGAPLSPAGISTFERVNALLLGAYMRKQKITIRFRCDPGKTPLILDARR